MYLHSGERDGHRKRKKEMQRTETQRYIQKRDGHRDKEIQRRERDR